MVTTEQGNARRMINSVAEKPDRGRTDGSVAARLRQLALAAFVALAVWLLVRLALAIIVPSSVWTPVLVSGPAAAVASDSRSYDFSYNPFEAGDAAVEPVIVADTGLDAPETTLDLRLTGLRSGENGSAFIRTPDGQDRNYYAADEIMPNVILRGVFPGHVLIDVNGQTQRLTMDDNKVSVGTSARNRDNPGALQTLRAPDARTLLSQVRIAPALNNNMDRVGVTLSARSAGIDLNSYGLRDGDIVTRFAGQSLASGLPDVAALRRAVSPGRPVQVDIIRDGAPMTITIGSPS